MSKKSITNVKIQRVNNTDRDVYVTWSFSAQHVKEYQVKWQYYTGNTKKGGKAVWFEGGTNTTTILNNTYSPPENATKVRVSIKAVSTTHKVKKKDVAYWTCGWSTAQTFTVDNIIKTVPVGGDSSTISITPIGTSGKTLQATWTWSRANTTGYEVTWQYQTANSGWLDGSTSTVTRPIATYEVPDGATQVAFRFKPTSNYWTSPESTWAYYNTANLPPATPSVPTVTINGYKVKATVSVYATVSNVEFYLVSEPASTYQTKKAALVNNSATVIFDVDGGKAYKVRARAINGTNVSEYSEYSSPVDAPPKSPGDFTSCVAISDSQVELTWPFDDYIESYIIEYTPKLEYFDVSPGNVQTAPEVSKQGRTIISIDAGSGDNNNTWWFRCKAKKGSVESGWNEPVSIAVGKKPSPPTTWSLTSTASVGDVLKLYWMHNSQDGSSQTNAILELTINGETRTEEVPNNREEDDKDKTSEFDLDTTDLTEGAIIKWKVKTKGAIAEYSDWSIEREIKIYAPATLNFIFAEKRQWIWDPFNFTTDSIYSSPAIAKEFPLVVDSLPIDISAIAGPSTQTALRYTVTIISLESYEGTDEDGTIKMVGENEEVYSAIVYPQKAATLRNYLLHSIGAGDITLENNIEYRLTCTVVMDSGLTASCEVEFTVGWADESFYPNAEVGIDEDAVTAYIIPYCEDEEENRIDDVLLSVYRRNYDGTFTIIGENLRGSENITVTDPHPSLDFVRYRIVAKDAHTGRVYFYDMPGVENPEYSIIIQWDEAWSNFVEDENEAPTVDAVWNGSLIRLPYNIDIQEQSAPDIEFVEYIGREHPVSYYGTQKGETATWNTVIEATDTEMLYQLRRLRAYMGDCYVREPNGAGYWAHVDVGISKTHMELIIPVTLTLTRVEGGA